MADTIGSLIDKLATVNQKLFLAQELVYEVRRMSFKEFFEKYIEPGGEVLYAQLHKICDLNLQRQNLITEVDQKIVAVAQAAARGEDLTAAVVQQHKTQTINGSD